MLELSVEDVVTMEVSEMVVVDDIVPDSEDVMAMKDARAMHNFEMVPDSVVSPDSEMVAAEDLNMRKKKLGDGLPMVSSREEVVEVGEKLIDVLLQPCFGELG
nr:unnamed protein product [Digitaria exilis]